MAKKGFNIFDFSGIGSDSASLFGSSYTPMKKTKKTSGKKTIKFKVIWIDQFGNSFSRDDFIGKAEAMLFAGEMRNQGHQVSVHARR